MSTKSANTMVKFDHDKIGKIGIITLDQPKSLNALSVELGQQFKSMVDTINDSLSDPQSDLDINSIILTGANSTFSTGGDIVWLKNLRDNPVNYNVDIMYNFYKSFLCIRDLPVPIISVIEGNAVGAGACLAIATDIRVMSSNARISFNFVKLGIHSGMGCSHFLPIVVGEAKSKEILFTGKTLKGYEAEAIGLVNQAVDTEMVMDEGKKLAMKIGKMHPLAVRSMVETMRTRENSLGGGLEAALRREALSQALCYARKDWGEGLDAAMEKRQPSFNGYHSDWL